MGDAYRDVVGSGGQVNVEFIPAWMAGVAGLGALPPTGQGPRQALNTVLRHLGGFANFSIPMMLDAVTGGKYAFDGDFYRQRSPLNVIDKVRVPTDVVGGEYDLFQRGEPMLYQRLAANKVTAKLTIGPWYRQAGLRPVEPGRRNLLPVHRPVVDGNPRAVRLRERQPRQ